MGKRIKIMKKLNCTDEELHYLLVVLKDDKSLDESLMPWPKKSRKMWRKCNEKLIKKLLSLTKD